MKKKSGLCRTFFCLQIKSCRDQSLTAMTIAHVDLVDVSNGMLVCSAVCAVFVGERVYVPLASAAVLAGRVVRAQPCDEDLRLPVEIHPECVGACGTLDVGRHGYEQTEAEISDLTTRDYCILANGVGVHLSKGKPEILHHATDDGAVTLAVFMTMGGVIPHTLITRAPPHTHTPDVVMQVLYDILTTRYRNTDSRDLHGTTIADEATMRDFCVLRLSVPRVVPVH